MTDEQLIMKVIRAIIACVSANKMYTLTEVLSIFRNVGFIAHKICFKRPVNGGVLRSWKPIEQNRFDETFI